MALVIQMLGVQVENCAKHYMSIWAGLKWPQDVRVDMKYRRGAWGKNHWLVCSGSKKMLVVCREKRPITTRPQVTVRLSKEGLRKKIMVLIEQLSSLSSSTGRSEVTLIGPTSGALLKETLAVWMFADSWKWSSYSFTNQVTMKEW